MSETKKPKLQLDYSVMARATAEDIANGNPESKVTDQDIENAASYVESVRAAYRRGYEYRGNRTEEQLEIADYAALESELFIDDYITALNLHQVAEDTLGNIENGVDLNDMRDAWRRLWVGFNIISNRIAAKKDPAFPLDQISELEPKQRILVMQKLFGDFQDHNALRFGATGMGLTQEKPKVDAFGMEMYDDMTGERLTTKHELDKLDTFSEIGRRALKIGYITEVARPNDNSGDRMVLMHPAGKLTPQKAKELRRQYKADFRSPEQFYATVSYLRDAEKSLENQGK